MQVEVPAEPDPERARHIERGKKIEALGCLGDGCLFVGCFANALSLGGVAASAVIAFRRLHVKDRGGQR